MINMKGGIGKSTLTLRYSGCRQLTNRFSRRSTLCFRVTKHQLIVQDLQDSYIINTNILLILEILLILYYLK